MEIKVYTINAFAKTAEGGNPAGVVLDADSLTEEQMKQIAKIIGFSETAFVLKSSKADFKVRFFTTTDEVDLCGHATIGTFSLLMKKGLLEAGLYTQETKAGVLEIEVKTDGTIMMEQTKPQFIGKIRKEEIAESLNIAVDDFDLTLEPQIVSTGLKDVMIPIKNKSILDSIQPDSDKVVELCKKYEVVGYHMFAPDTLYHDTAYCRNIAPLFGIPEEAATGTSNGALACYLVQYGQYKNETENMIFEQGYYMKRPSEICATVKTNEGIIEKVQVGGIAMNIQEKIVTI